MAMDAFLSQLATVIGLIASALVICIVVRALWAEIGPMVRLIFRRVPLTGREEDERM
jgi:hypothetical protein